MPQDQLKIAQDSYTLPPAWEMTVKGMGPSYNPLCREEIKILILKKSKQAFKCLLHRGEKRKVNKKKCKKSLLLTITVMASTWSGELHVFHYILTTTLTSWKEVRVNTH